MPLLWILLWLCRIRRRRWLRFLGSRCGRVRCACPGGCARLGLRRRLSGLGSGTVSCIRRRLRTGSSFSWLLSRYALACGCFCVRRWRLLCIENAGRRRLSSGFLGWLGSDRRKSLRQNVRGSQCRRGLLLWRSLFDDFRDDENFVDSIKVRRRLYLHDQKGTTLGIWARTEYSTDG